MNHPNENRPAGANPLDAIYAPVVEELHAVEAILREELTSRYDGVDRVVKHGFRLGGKRLRPALVLLAGKAVGKTTEVHRTLGAAVELIHTATLVHDDVLDEAELRRHVDTVNARWNNETSILLGDYLLTRALCLAASTETTFACRLLGECSRAMCEGELLQVLGRGNIRLPEKDYLEIIEGKTGALCACCCEFGAYYADAPPAIRKALTRYGLLLGVAFQIVDDLLDLLGEEDTVGKSLGRDLEKRKLTLPLIHLFGQMEEEDQRRFESVWNEEGGDVREFFQNSQARREAVAFARAKAETLITEAKDGLAPLNDTPGKESLLSLADFVLSRSH